VLDRELETKGERVGKFLKKYGKITNVFKVDLAEIGKSLSDTEVEDLKDRVSDFLKESRSKVIVFIDDIDRLDKSELFALFKLIKLTGDFAKTYYILSFDDEMVAAAIGERFAHGTSTSGQNFLEKIIQVPLRIPQALSADLLDFVFELLNKILAENEIDLGKDEEQNIGLIIASNVLPRIKTPRLAIRYANSLSFLIPLLKGEVNLSDLILFEAIKIFYPKHYDFIKEYPRYFIETYTAQFSNGRDNEKVEEFKNKLQELNQDLSQSEKSSIISLLTHLFPRTKAALENYNSYYSQTNFEKEQRIASPKYFDKYFIYSVPRGVISDIRFDDYISKVSENVYDQVLEETMEMIIGIDASEFLTKIELYSDTLDWQSKQTLIKIISTNSEDFKVVREGFLLGLQNSKSKAAIAIANLLVKHADYDERLEVAKSLMKSEVLFDFSVELIRWLLVGKSDDEKAIKTVDRQLLENLLLERALRDAEESRSTLFEKHETFIFTLLKIWYTKDPKDLCNYIDTKLEANAKLADIIIYSLTSTIYSTEGQHKIDFKEETYKMLKNYYSVEKLRSYFTPENYPEIDDEEVKFFDIEEGQTKINAIRQFIHWYELDIKEAQN
ncbi:MAG TPA: P-loop NTPase fold protein, partial [Candidatus Saccharimonadia bacterium]|nr:P-loop NTPase fold protein [Candidatus Saccharimonadia bacterium]